MKYSIILLTFFMMMLLTLSFTNASANNFTSDKLEGSWKLQDGNTQHILMIQDNYYSHTSFDIANKMFMQTNGGTYKVNGKQVSTVIEFNTNDKSSIGQSTTYNFSINDNQLTFNDNGSQLWQRVDDGSENLAGTWKITARKNEGVLSPIHQSGARKTLKILSGTRFQWVAINPETKEFFGTGGGTYSFNNGKYTENIEFFSRDNTRVGASLSFDGKLENGDWHHSGKSSTGNDIYEVWSRINK